MKRRRNNKELRKVLAEESVSAANMSFGTLLLGQLALNSRLHWFTTLAGILLFLFGYLFAIILLK